jgi:hypothetical protein
VLALVVEAAVMMEMQTKPVAVVVVEHLLIKHLLPLLLVKVLLLLLVLLALLALVPCLTELLAEHLVFLEV